MSVGKNGTNLSNNRKTDILRPIRFKLLAFGNGDDNDVPKLPKECLKLEIFGTVLMTLILIHKLFILSAKIYRLDSKNI